MTIKRLHPTTRKLQLLDVAVKLAETCGWQNLTRRAVAEGAGCSHSLINAYWPTVADLQDSVMRAAVRREVLPVIAQGLAVKDWTALSAPAELRARAAGWMVGV